VAIQRNSSTLEGKDSASAYIGTCVGGQGLRPNANDERHFPRQGVIGVVKYFHMCLQMNVCAQRRYASSIFCGWRKVEYTTVCIVVRRAVHESVLPCSYVMVN